MDANPMERNISFYQLILMARDVEREVIELRTFVRLTFRQPSEQLTEEWVNSRQVMSMLRITKVTLQNLRDFGKLPYSSINGKFYYKTTDVEKLLKSNYRKRRGERAETHKC